MGVTTSGSKPAIAWVLARRISILNTDNLLMIVASLLLLAIDWLAFHDLREPHTVRDWLMLVASVLVFLKFGKEFWNRYLRQHGASQR
jgi:O-antigen ligase